MTCTAQHSLRVMHNVFVLVWFVCYLALNIEINNFGSLEKNMSRNLFSNTRMNDRSERKKENQRDYKNK